MSQACMSHKPIMLAAMLRLLAVVAFGALVQVCSATADVFRESVYQRLIKNSETRIRARNAWMEGGGQLTAFQEAKLSDPGVVALLAPYHACPWTLERTLLVNEVYDGGKWTCGVREMADRAEGAPPCIVYSFGSDGNDIFEKHLERLAPRCEVHVFDPTSAPLERWHFHSYGLCASGDSFSAKGQQFPCKGLPAIMGELGHQHVDILKMDVEGAEWEVISKTDWRALKIGQLLVEVHDFGGAYPLSALIRDYFGKLESAGFMQFSIEPVCPGCGGQYELAWLHRGWRPARTLLIGPKEPASYDEIEAAFDKLDAFTQQKFSDYGDRKWGIASIGLFEKKKTTLMYEELMKVQAAPPLTACELGFMAGHTSLFFLEALPGARVYSFDLNDNPWTQRNADYLQELYGERFFFIPGDSALTVPAFRAEHPDVTCDVMLIDGSKDGDHRTNDIRTFRKMSHEGALLFLDEVNSYDCVSGQAEESSAACNAGPYSSCSKAYQRLSRSGEIVVERCVATKIEHDGYCAARFGPLV